MSFLTKRHNYTYNYKIIHIIKINSSYLLHYLIRKIIRKIAYFFIVIVTVSKTDLKTPLFSSKNYLCEVK